MTRIFPGHWMHTVLGLGALLCWWAGFFQTFGYEWWVNEQYSYGFLVPFLTLYLLFLRFPTRPEPSKDAGHWAWWIFPLLAVFLCIPLRTVLVSNPEWRAALWAYALFAYGSTLTLFGAIGGRSWIRHFSLPLGLVLFAVPWPTNIEQPVVLELMGAVTKVTVEALNLLGYYAQQEGNLIRLSTGRIGVEEACSGVRSFQSTLMAAFFLGELFQWKFRYRLALLVAGSSVSLLLNFARTLILTLVAIRRGSAAMEEIHDPVGHIVSVGSFVVLFVLTWLLHRRFLSGHHSPLQPSHRKPSEPLQELFPTRLALAPAVIILIFFGTQYIFASVWFNRGPETPLDRRLVEIDWGAFADEPKETPIAPGVRAILRYTDGEQIGFRWRNQFWTGYFFRWEAGRISSHIAVHRPDVCLPSAGFQLVESDAPLTWREGGLDFSFSTNRYRFGERDYYVFYGMWDTASSRQVPLATTWEDRLSNAWHGLRIDERQSLELILLGPPSMTQAKESVRRFLSASLSVTGS